MALITAPCSEQTNLDAVSASVYSLGMNIKLHRYLVFAACSLFMMGSALSAPESYTSAWLKAGCVASIVVENDRENYTADQHRIFSRVLMWTNGFMQGANSMCLADAGEGKSKGASSKLTFPPDKWLSFSKLAPEILEFMRANPEIADSVAAREVMMAFYYLNHPDASAREKILGGNLLRDITKDAAKE